MRRQKQVRKSRENPVTPPAAVSLPRFRFDRTDVIKAAILIAAVFLAYSPAIRAGIVWDDVGHLTAPGLQSLHGLFRIWTEPGATQQYYPLLHSAFWLEHRIWGDALAGYHLINIVFHIISSLLLVVIARRLKIPGGWLAAFLFALHPVATESVAWISEQKNTLSTVLYLVSTLFYLRFDRERKTRAYVIAFILYLASLMAKSVTATLPLTLLAIFWWERGRLSWKRDVQPLLPWIAAGIVSGALTSWVERVYIGASGSQFDLSLLDRCLLAGRVIFFYLAKLFWPANLTFFYPRWTIDASQVWQYIFPLAALLLAAGLWAYARRKDDLAHRAPIAGFAAFVIAIGPALGFVNVYPFVYSFVADHFQYLGMMPVFLAVSAGAAVAARRMGPEVRWAPAIAGVVLVILAVLTWRQTGIYRDEETLFRDTIARNPGSWVAYLDLAQVLSRTKGHEKEGLALTEKAIELRPENANSWVSHGSFLWDSGDQDDAMRNWRKAVQLEPNLGSAHSALGDGLAAMPGGLDQAIAEYRTAIRLSPSDWRGHAGLGAALSKNPATLSESLDELHKAIDLGDKEGDVHFRLGNVLTQMGSVNDAIAEYRTALGIAPDLPEAHLNLAAALLHIPNARDNAIAEFREALRLDPHYAEAHYDLGTVLSDIPGQTDAAIAEYEAALRDNPNLAGAHLNLGIALEDMPGRRAEAIAHLRSAVQSDPNFAEARYELGEELLASHGNPAEAIEQFRAALRARPDFKPARDVLDRLHVNAGS
ncbi:MAG TPA: tetratricopeptide repeat protein [Bryobacteraceae bacterium]|nr:tetratricopeptide repeat protein [Bryobacteraceae bacterium]